MTTEQVSSDLLILPGDPRFTETLGRSLPVGYEHIRDKHNGDVAYVCRYDLGGVVEAVSLQEATDYAYGGEWQTMDEYNEELSQEHYCNAPEWLL